MPRGDRFYTLTTYATMVSTAVGYEIHFTHECPGHRAGYSRQVRSAHTMDRFYAWSKGYTSYCRTRLIGHRRFSMLFDKDI